MSRIRLLSDALASQVAAGEVVERPASVVKELLENSIDAEARKIEVGVQRGGMSKIQIIDDGIGMNRDDALMCLERHATSKIRTTEDLGGISTLGFRGEAIPSIASVSKFRLTTREKDALSGTEIVINGGKIASVKDCGEPPGTQIEVRQLFFNIPARRKFLRTENTEYSHIEQVVRVQAIAHPDIAFTLVRNDREQFRLPATESLLERIQGFVGSEIASRLLPVAPYESGDIRITGFMGGFGMGRSTRSLQLTFLNGRPVEAPMLNYALREGYHTALMKGQYPLTFLFLEMSPYAVDVNVHPAKKEVRFRDGNGVRDAVIEALQKTLTRAQTTIPGQRVHSLPEPPPPSQDLAELATQPSLIPEREQLSLRKDWIEPEPTPPPSSPSPEPASPPETAPAAAEFEPPVKAVRSEDFRIIGVLGKLYVLMESAEGLVLMDQHAAHERVLFEKMRERMANEGVPTQKLLMPLTVELAPRDFDLVQQNLDAIQRLGIAAEPFGQNTLKIDSLPQFFKKDDPAKIMNDVVEELKKVSRRMSSMRLGEDMVATTVCRYAVKANDSLRPLEVSRLLDDLLDCELPYCCPHGRPTLIQMPFGELEKRFGRTA
ncbi:MAG: DNA mismatch repair protein MutL [Verrucomicrobiales bacterium]